MSSLPSSRGVLLLFEEGLHEAGVLRSGDHRRGGGEVGSLLLHVRGASGLGLGGLWLLVLFVLEEFRMIRELRKGRRKYNLAIELWKILKMGLRSY